ncbi:prepilin-type N-terminal cleavage/methylation domain-containing protein [Staphylococcus pseudintermedius]|uniref:prepilin-type N-terminal cleavage/methylation domain-containing protein n=1 Tax=Staphylococcus pseudintermedius TaxID=283734 RepID=UPI001CA45727|nr:prepilin-type N-terminal cleavage/methylation domain-containing protein [Staphylococcus pseudintermedius]MBC8683135.1 prepilin-type N-terminal cleavage/methylation domain-containing protein [Staphylococcus pseudintermedius]
MKLFRQHINCVYKIIKPNKNIAIERQGFTLIESLVALVIQMTIVLLIPLLIFSLGQLKTTVFEDRTYDIELMIKDISHTLHAKDVKAKMIKKKELEIRDSNTEINYKLRNQKIIKTVGHRGNITMCNHVVDVHFEKLTHDLMLMKITYQEGTTTHEKEILL